MKELLSRIAERDLTSFTGQAWSYSPRPKEWVLAAAGMAASLAQSLAGGSQVRREQKRQEETLAIKAANDNASYAAQKNISENDTARGQNSLRVAADQADDITRRGAGEAAMNGTNSMQSKEEANKLITDAMANNAAAGTARQDQAEQSKMAADASNAAAAMQLAAGREKNAADNTKLISDAFAQAAGTAEAAFGSKAPATQAAGTPSASQINAGLNSAWNNSQQTAANLGKPTLSQTLQQRNQQFMNDFSKRAAANYYTVGDKFKLQHPNLFK